MTPPPGVRTEYGSNGKVGRGAVLLIALGLALAVAAVLTALRGPLRLSLEIPLSLGALLCLALGCIQLWISIHPFRLTIGADGITIQRAGRTSALPWGDISRVAVERASPTFRADSLKVWPAPGATLPPRAGARGPNGALVLCEVNLLDGTAAELLDSLRHFAPANLVAPVP